jgi:hypothetical protein
MKRQVVAVLCSAILGFMASFSLAIAQQKTAKACLKEWRANKTTNQANRVAEQAYVAQCRAGGAPTLPSAAPAPPTAPIAGSNNAARHRQIHSSIKVLWIPSSTPPQTHFGER